MALRLTIVSRHGEKLGQRRVKEFGPDGGTIGRALDCAWPLPDPKRYLSSRHASIDFRSGSYYIVDTSTNGVYVNGADHPVGRGKPQRLFTGDRIRFGEYEIAVEVDDDTIEPLIDQRYIDPVDRAQRVEAPEPTGEDLVDAFEVTGVGYEMQLTDDEFSTLTPPKKAEPDLELVFEDCGDHARTVPHLGGLMSAARVATPPQKATAGRGAGAESAPVASAAKARPAAAAKAATGAKPSVAAKPAAAPKPTVASQPATAPKTPIATQPATVPKPPVAERPAATVKPAGAATAGTTARPASAPAPSAKPASAPRTAEAKPATPGNSRPPATPVGTPAAPSPQAVSATKASTPEVAASSPPVTPPGSSAPGPGTKVTGLNAKASASAVDAFFRGAGLDPQRLDAQQAEALMQSVGQVMREMIVGMSEALHLRAEQKTTLRLPTTTIQPQDNNPLKFSAGVEETLHNLLLRESQQYLPPVEAVREAYADLKQHQQALLRSLCVALDAFVARLDPDELETKFARGRGRLMGAASKLKYWDLYKDLYDVVAHHPPGELPVQFLDDFSNAYERELDAADNRAPSRPAGRKKAI